MEKAVLTSLRPVGSAAAGRSFKAPCFKLICLLGILLALLACPLPALAGSRPDPGAPEELAAWRSWVLYGHEEQYLCPDAAPNPDPDDRRPLCAWPLRLELDLNEQGGRFTTVFELKNERAFPLPGGPGAWPLEVSDAKGQAVPVGGRISPQVWLPAGRHSLSGSFRWAGLPESLTLPAGFILDLKIDGQTQDFPPLEVNYQNNQIRLWLRKKAEEPQEADPTLAAVDRLTINVNRLIQDSQPIMVKSRFRLTVSGRPREVLLSGALLPETRATFLSSPLPAQLTPEGLRVRVKPGTYEIFLDSRSLGRSESLGPVPGQAAGTEPQTARGADEAQPVSLEYWAFQAQTNLRLVEVSGADQIDASQADIYSDWRQYPIYVLEPGQSLKFTTLRRGDAEPKPDDLKLLRECWLDYDGRGLSCRDRLTGSLSRQWHLNASPPFTLSQASLDGQPQVITWQLDSKGRPAPGLQMRNAQVNLSADLRIDDFQGILPASGWDHKLETEGQRLNLPPGYRLFHVSGAEALQGHRHSGAGTWTGAWETLDFFIILIISIAVWKLYGRPQGILALFTLVLCYHEALAPRMVFLHLVIAAALLRLLPGRGKARFLVRSWRFLAALTLVILAAFFLIEQARITLHPQLENPRAWYDDRLLDGLPLPDASAPKAYNYQGDYYDQGQPEEESVRTEPVPTIQNTMNAMRFDPVASPTAPEPVAERVAAAAQMPSPQMQKPVMERDFRFRPKAVFSSAAKDAKIQNSLPRPGWQWRSVSLYYNSSVSADQKVKLYLQTPTVGRLLGLMRIGLMAAFVLVMLSGGQLLRRPHRDEPAETPAPSPIAKTAVALLLLLGLSLASAGPALAQSDFPRQELLDEYRNRLLHRAPQPATTISEARLEAGTDTLSLTLTVDAVSEEVLGLPSLDQEIFRFQRLSLDGLDLPLLEDQGRWLTLIPAGRHQVVLSGRLKKSKAAGGFQISFPNGYWPRRLLVENSSAWQVEGLEEDGQLRGNGLFLNPGGSGMATGAAGAEEEAEQPTTETLSPFFLVKRILSLGLEWRMWTTVQRITPDGAPVSLKLPLLTGEVPITGDLRSTEGQVTLNFGPKVNQLSWESSLPITSELLLTAAEGAWTESWLLDVSPIWRVESRGLTPIRNIDGNQWQPYWKPWPGESLTLKVDRPEPVPGRYLVIDQAQLAVTVAEHNQLNNLNFKLRSSQGGPYAFSLPPGSEVREFKVDGRNVPLSSGVEALQRNGGGPTLTASLNAGDHNLEVVWIQDMEMGAVALSPELDLKAPIANLNLSLTLPQDRWILWTWGPLQGPAVEFWPLLAVIALAALALARLTHTPLGWGAWFLLGLGLIQVNVIGALIVAGWLLALSRRLRPAQGGAFRFNFKQILLALWTIIALILIYYGIKMGLLQNPDMLISGGGSYGQRLSWFIDRSPGSWPAGGVLSVSVWFYKALMLAWSLWLAVSLIKWLKWGWESFSHEGLWKKKASKQTRADQAPDRPKADSTLNDDKRLKNDDGK